MSDGESGSGLERRAKVGSLAEGLRKLADTLESNQAIYEPIAFERQATQLAQALREFMHREPALHRIQERMFLECRAAWLRAWQQAPGEMETRCEQLLGRLPHHVADESEVSWRLHLLVEVLAQMPDPVRVLAMTETRGCEDRSPDVHVEDRGATDALLTWGQMTPEEFLLSWGRFDPELLRRCAALVGVTLTRPTLAAKRKLHTLAVRMFRNTRM